MHHSENEPMVTGFKPSQMLKTPTKKQEELFDSQLSSSKLNGDVMAQGAIGSFFARSNSKAKFGSNSKFESMNNLTRDIGSTIPDEANNSRQGGMYDSFQSSRRKSQGDNFSQKQLPSIDEHQNLNKVATLTNGLNNFATRSGSDFRVGRVMK